VRLREAWSTRGEYRREDPHEGGGRQPIGRGPEARPSPATAAAPATEWLMAAAYGRQRACSPGSDPTSMLCSVLGSHRPTQQGRDSGTMKSRLQSRLSRDLLIIESRMQS
jgi:hypothetical protein